MHGYKKDDKEVLMSDKYVRISVELRVVRENSILVEHDGDTQWIPRSLIHGGDDRGLDEESCQGEIELRIFEWKLGELGWI